VHFVKSFYSYFPGTAVMKNGLLRQQGRILLP